MKLVHGFILIIAALVALTVVPVLAQQADKPAKMDVFEKAQKPAKAAVTGKININTATAEQLAMLPGVSLKKANGLIDYRTQKGAFKNIEDLQKVPGVKQKKIDKVKDYIIFDGETTLQAVK